MKALFVITYYNDPDQICNFNDETGKVLSANNIVFGFLTHRMVSILDLLKGKACIIESRKDFFYYYPLKIIPFNRYRKIKYLNLSLNAFLLTIFLKIHRRYRKFSSKYLWLFHPYDYEIFGLIMRHYQSIYDVVDYSVANELKDNIKIKENEMKLLKRINRVYTISYTLKEYLKAQAVNARIVPQGFAADAFNTTNNLTEIKDSLLIKKASKYSALIGFIGNINCRIDYDLLLHLVRDNRNYLFALIGPTRHESDNNFNYEVFPTKEWIRMLKKETNVFIKGEVIKREELPWYINQFTIGIIPYNIKQEFNFYCYPMKLFEYFYMGKPVISTPINELYRFSKYVTLADTSDQWSNAIKNIIKKPWPKAYVVQQRKLALANSWQNKVHTILKSL